MLPTEVGRRRARGEGEGLAVHRPGLVPPFHVSPVNLKKRVKPGVALLTVPARAYLVRLREGIWQ